MHCRHEKTALNHNSMAVLYHCSILTRQQHSCHTVARPSGLAGESAGGTVAAGDGADAGIADGCGRV